MRFERTWQVSWLGHRIVVYNWWNLFLQSGCEISIDGSLLDKKDDSGLVTGSRELEGTVRTGGTVYSVRARIGQLARGGSTPGCHIFVDGKLIGGDMNEAFLADGNTKEALQALGEVKVRVSDIKWLLLVVLVFAIPAISLGTFDSYDVEWYGFLEVMKYVVVAGTIGYFLCAQYFGWGREKKHPIARLAYRILPGAVLSCLLAGYVVLINANIGPQQGITVSGTVVDKIEWWPGRRKPRYYLVVKGSDDLWRIRVDKTTFVQTGFDAPFKQAGWSKGSLGILYR
jgi:hypothetical protein